jgi:hypothetical protein
MKVLFYSILPDFQKSIKGWKIYRLRPCGFLGRATCVDKYVYGALVELC